MPPSFTRRKVARWALVTGSTGFAGCLSGGRHRRVTIEVANLVDADQEVTLSVTTREDALLWKQELYLPERVADEVPSVESIATFPDVTKDTSYSLAVDVAGSNDDFRTTLTFDCTEDEAGDGKWVRVRLLPNPPGSDIVIVDDRQNC